MRLRKLRFEVSPVEAGPLFEREVPGRARLVEVETGVAVGEFRFEADCEFVEPVVKASEMTIYPPYRGRGYAKRFLGEFFRYLHREARRRDEEIVVNGDITSKTILHIWRTVADEMLFATELHGRTRHATAVHLSDARGLAKRTCERLAAALPDLAAQDERGFLKKPCRAAIGIASLIEPDLYP
jgi:GNAT superfamily N-acetyltransferase